jgi:GR25 family glycosyltransferase involved in LPS biosynthesis
MRTELGNLRDRCGNSLVEMTRRVAAVDARYLDGPVDAEQVRPHYLLADQLFVEPNPRLAGLEAAESERIQMTRQEIAVALSHIAVWRRIAAGAPGYSLVLEDDVCFCHGFARTADRAWAALVQEGQSTGAFDVLYLSYQEAITGAAKGPVSAGLFRPLRGLWQLSGYVLSARGAQKLLDALPVCGPVDLWINHQFDSLEVLATERPIIQQRPDCPSSNAYSVLPVLSKVGVLTREKPLLREEQPLPGPVFGIGEPGSGLTALACALSMLGYRCCSDVAELPDSEREKLFGNKRNRVFNAYVNIGSLRLTDLAEFSKVHRNARFIVTSGTDDDSRESAGADLINQLSRMTERVLVLPRQHTDMWGLVCDFLGCDYPGDQYPRQPDLGQRSLCTGAPEGDHLRPGAVVALKCDPSPWVAKCRDWHGVPLAESASDGSREPEQLRICTGLENLDGSLWKLRTDTFPSNLALFTPNNFSVDDDAVGWLTLCSERTSVREFTSASVSSRERYLYGRFAAQMRPSGVSGLITGLFLHRNSPRQEIDIEFLGRDTTKMLVNVYYNPGSDGARIEYGYRGAPAMVDLGFDAADSFHRYEIEWTPNAIRWYVDGALVHQRVNWDPTPIPRLPMELNVNLWHSRSEELAGRLARRKLPARAGLLSIEIASQATGDKALGFARTG